VKGQLPTNQIQRVKILKSFSTYALSTLFNQGVSFLLIPVFTHYLLPSEYGVLSLVNTTVSLLTITIMVGADGSIRRQFYKLKDDDYARFFSSAFFTSVVSFVFISLLTGLIAFTFSFRDFIPRKWLLLSPLIAFTSVLPTIILGQFRVKQQVSSFALFSNLMTLANLGLAIAFVAGLRMGYAGRLYSTLGVNTAFFLCGFIILYKKKLLGRKIDWQHVRTSLKYGLPLIPHQLGAFVISFSDRYFIARLVPGDKLSEVGIYNLAYSIGGIIGIIESTFSYAFMPYLFEALTDGSEKAKLRIVKLSYLFMFALVLATLALGLGSGLLFDWFIRKDYHSGTKYVIWVAAGYMFSGFYKVFTGYIFYSSKTIYLAYLAIVNVVLNITLNYFLISRYQTIGAAYATLISFIVMFFITMAISTRLVKMPWLKWRAVLASPLH
jgi:O-antigen/teichoic acid export membrane protein